MYKLTFALGDIVSKNYSIERGMVHGYVENIELMYNMWVYHVYWFHNGSHSFHYSTDLKKYWRSYRGA